MQFVFWVFKLNPNLSHKINVTVLSILILYLMVEVSVLGVFPCVFMYVFVVLDCGNWWQGSTADHSWAILQSLRSNNMVSQHSLPPPVIKNTMVYTYLLNGIHLYLLFPDVGHTTCLFSVLPNFEVKLMSKGSFFYVDSQELIINIKATYAKVLVSWIWRPDLIDW